MLMLYVWDLLLCNFGVDILYDVKCIWDVVELVSSFGGCVIMCVIGYLLMKVKMKEFGVVVGGELFGYIFFNDCWYGFDDVFYSVV